MIYDVAIIGAGVSGAFVARSLSRCTLQVCLMEKSIDLAMSTSGANSGIVHGGYDAKYGTMKSVMNIRGMRMMENICHELSVPYNKCGSLVLAFNEEEEESLRELLENGLKSGLEGLRIITRQEVIHLEPHINREVTGALHCVNAGVVCPYKLNIAAVENAVANGVTLKRSAEAKSIRRENGVFCIETGQETIRSRFLVNCAGMYADEVAAMAGDDSIHIIPVKGEYLLFDRTEGDTVRSVLFQPPSDLGKGVLVTPTTDGNLLLGPDANTIRDKDDMSTNRENMEYIQKTALRSVENINYKKVITTFSGIRATPQNGDFIIGASKSVENLVNVAGIESPGLTAAPAIGEHVAGILEGMGLEMLENRDYDPFLHKPVPFRDMTPEQRDMAIREEPDYGKIICRCETVTLAEIKKAIRNPVGALTVDGVKRRTRAGMGRCQGGFCIIAVLETLSRELGIPLEEVKKSNPGSYILAGRSRT
ncbi:MAG: NAD(P)/FAD-dependent oxidoreductase [Clostridia bacterium]